LRYLTLDTPTSRIKEQTSMLRPELSMQFNQQGRITPRIPRIGTASLKSNPDISRPIFMIRKPLSMRYNPERKVYLESHVPRGAIKMQIQHSRKRSQIEPERYAGSTNFKKDRRPIRLIGFELNQISSKKPFSLTRRQNIQKVRFFVF
jgi:hypothetical protein